MNIFSEVKEHLTARQVAESYGLKIRQNGVACCPFHNDKHPSMKIGENYYCFACGAKGDAIGYTAQMFGLSQYEAAKKLVKDFGLPITVGAEQVSREEKVRTRKKAAEQERIVHIKERFNKWSNQTIDLLKDSLSEIEEVSVYLKGKPPDAIFSNDYVQMLHAEPIINYWLDILCLGSIDEKQELFLKGRKEVGNIVERIKCSRKRIMERNRRSLECRDEQCGRCAF